MIIKVSMEDDYVADTRSRRWCMTINNYNKSDIEKIELCLNTSYHVIGEEVGENGTPHLQIYLEFKNAMRFSTLKKYFHDAHIEAALGPPWKAANYCKKDGKFIESGELSKQGERTDLKKLTDSIRKGETNTDILLFEDPYKIHQYGRTLNMIETKIMNSNHRTEAPKALWLWGETGVGKSHIAYNGKSPNECYIWRNDHGWWDDYMQQKYVIFNDFRGEIPYNELLQMLDKWPYRVSRRNKPPILFNSPEVIFTSSLPPEKIYKNRMAEDNIAQLLRRLTVTEVVSGNTKSETILDITDYD